MQYNIVYNYILCIIYNFIYIYMNEKAFTFIVRTY